MTTALPDKFRCRVCHKVACVEHCQYTPDGQHQPTAKTVEVGEAIGLHDVAISIRCGFCGQVGTFTARIEDVQWGP